MSQKKDVAPSDGGAGRISTGTRVVVPLGRRNVPGRLVKGTVANQSGREWWVVYDKDDAVEYVYEGGYYNESEIEVQEDLDRKEKEAWRQTPSR